MPTNSGFPFVRPRRVRADESTRRLVREHHLMVDDLIYPVFVREGKGLQESVASMPGVHRYSPDTLMTHLEEVVALGIPAIAFSQVDKGWGEIDAAAAKAREIVAQLLHSNLVAPVASSAAAPWLLNVNIPNMPLQALKPLKLCRLGRRHAAERVITQESPRGEVMYWIGGAGPAKDDAEGTDFHATAQGHVSVTPLQVDLTDHQRLPYWAPMAALLSQPKGRA